MDFGEIFRKAWKIIWKHKILWLFGVLAGCGAANAGGGGGGGGGGSSAMQEMGQSNNWEWNGHSFLSPSTQRAFEDFFEFLAEIPVGVWVTIGLFVVFSLIFVGIILSLLSLFVGTLGTTGVIKGTSLGDQAEPDAKPLSFGRIFNGLKSSYWKVLLFTLGIRVVGFFVVLLLLLPIILLVTCTCGLGVFFLIPIGWLIKLLVEFTTIAIVDEGIGVFEGIERAWKVIFRNFGNVVLMWFILGIGQIIIGLIIGLPLIFGPILPILITLFVTNGRIIGVGVLIAVILFLLFIPLLIFLGGVLRAYVLASWTLTYRRLTGESAQEPSVLNQDALDEEEIEEEEET
jgi:hypothetical protein